MKKSFLLIKLLVLFLVSNAQTHTESFVACSNSYTTVCDLQSDNSVKISITDGSDTSKHNSYFLTTTDIDVFAKSFKQAFFTMRGDEAGCSADDTDRIISYGRKLYLNYLKSYSDTTSPIAGTIKIHNNVPVNGRYKISLNQKDTVFEFNNKSGFLSKVTKVQIEISEGYITNLKAYTTYNNNQFQFILPFPMGISSVGNLKKYGSCKLYEVNSSIYFRKKLTDAQEQIKKGKANVKLDSSFYIFLGDLLDYDYSLEVDRRDYSPQNQKLILRGGESKILYKAPTNRLFEAHIYTDFIGLNEEKPNGLIQTEVSKRININSRQHIISPFFYGIIKSIGFSQYLSPSVTFSKIEQHNKRLVLGDLDSVFFHPGSNDTSKFNHNLHRYVSALDLYQYQSFSAGVDFNIFSLNNNDLKFGFDFNLGARLGITQVTDSLTSIAAGTINKTNLVNNYSINTFQFYPEVTVTFLPEERFNLSLSDRVIYFKSLNSNVQQIEYNKHNYSKISPETKTWLNSLHLLMTIQVNPNSKLFGKVKLNSDLQDLKSNFAQVQVGYSTFILGNK